MDSKKFIIKNIDEIPLTDRKELLKLIQRTPTKISECADGCRINLDKLHAETINLIYMYVKNRLDYHNLISEKI